jgi:hypothetical protein
MAKNGPDRTNATIDQFMRIAKHAPKTPRQPITLEEQIAHQALQQRERYAQEVKDRKQRDIDRETRKNTPMFSGTPQGRIAEMEYLKKKKQEEANKKK